MARPLRIEFEGARYHVMNHGGARQAIFLNAADRRSFSAPTADISAGFDAEIHAYRLMLRGNLAHIMRHINGLYTQACVHRARRGRPEFYITRLAPRNNHVTDKAIYFHPGGLNLYPKSIIR